jgi:hypothetical protein
MSVNDIQHFADDPIDIFVRDLTGADPFVSPSSILEDQGTHIDCRCPINDAVSDRYHGKFLFFAVYDPQRYILLGV